MFVMPFQILGVWIRGLLALFCLGLAIYLLYEWYDHRQTHVTEVRTVFPAEGRAGQAADANAPRQEDQPPARREERVVPSGKGRNQAVRAVQGNGTRQKSRSVLG
jgi:hypothetical protein